MTPVSQLHALRDAILRDDTKFGEGATRPIAIRCTWGALVTLATDQEHNHRGTYSGWAAKACIDAAIEKGYFCNECCEWTLTDEDHLCPECATQKKSENSPVFR